MAELKHFTTSLMEPTRVALRIFLPSFVTFGGVTDVHSGSNYKPEIKNASNGVDIIVSSDSKIPRSLWSLRSDHWFDRYVEDTIREMKALKRP